MLHQEKRLSPGTQVLKWGGLQKVENIGKKPEVHLIGTNHRCLVIFLMSPEKLFLFTIIHFTSRKRIVASSPSLEMRCIATGWNVILKTCGPLESMNFRCQLTFLISSQFFFNFIFLETFNVAPRKKIVAFCPSFKWGSLQKVKIKLMKTCGPFDVNQS